MNAQSSPFTALLSNLTQAMKPDPNAMALVRLPPPAAHLPATQPSDGSVEVTVSPSALPILHARPRTGAVASLPRDKRDLVGRMIANGVTHKKIALALAELGFVLTDRNISNWITHGGYAEWCALCQDSLQSTLRQDSLLQYHRTDNSPDLAEVGLQAAATRLSEALMRQAAAGPNSEPNLSKLEPVINLLCRINKELLAVQKHRDEGQSKAYRTPARIQNQAHDKLVQVEAKYIAGARPRLIDSPADSPTAAAPNTTPQESAPCTGEPATPSNPPSSDPICASAEPSMQVSAASATNSAAISSPRVDSAPLAESSTAFGSGGLAETAEGMVPKEKQPSTTLGNLQ